MACTNVVHRVLHLEIGAGNYGIQGACEGKPGGHPNQYRVLKHTIDDLVMQNPNKPITVIINDLDRKVCEFAVEKVQEYVAKAHASLDIQFAVLAKDYRQIKLPEDLPKGCGEGKLISIHLKHPDANQLEKDFKNIEWLLNLEAFAETPVVVFSYENLAINSYPFAPSGKKSSKPYRYEKSVNPFPRYNYVRSWGEEEVFSTFSYTIRKRTEDETYTPEEIVHIKQQVEQEYKSKVDLAIQELQQEIDEDPSLFLLIQAFAQKKYTNYAQKIQVSDLSKLEDYTEESIQLVYSRLEEEKNGLIERLKKDKKLALTPLNQVVSSKVYNFLKVKKEFSKKFPDTIWGRLGGDIRSAYLSKFKDKKFFWASQQSLKEIYDEFLTLSKL